MTFWKKHCTPLVAHRRALRYLISLEEVPESGAVDQESLGQAKAFLRAVFSGKAWKICVRASDMRSLNEALALGRMHSRVLPDVKEMPGTGRTRSRSWAIAQGLGSLARHRGACETQGLNLFAFSGRRAALRWFHDRRQGWRPVMMEIMITTSSTGPAIEDPTPATDRRQAPRHIVRGEMQVSA